MRGRRDGDGRCSPFQPKHDGHDALQPRTDAVGVQQRQQGGVVQRVGGAGARADDRRLIADDVGDGKHRQVGHAAGRQRHRQPPRPPAQHAPTDGVHLVDGQAGAQQRLRQVGHVRLGAGFVAHGLRQRRDRGGAQRRGPAGQQHEHYRPGRDGLHRLAQRVGGGQRRRSGDGVVALDAVQRCRERRVGVGTGAGRMAGHHHAAGHDHAGLPYRGGRAGGHGGGRFPQRQQVDGGVGGHGHAGQPVGHRLARAGKRRRALHRRLMQAAEQGAGIGRDAHRHRGTGRAAAEGNRWRVTCRRPTWRRRSPGRCRPRRPSG